MVSKVSSNKTVESEKSFEEGRLIAKYLGEVKAVRRSGMSSSEKLEELEEVFIAFAKSFGDENGIVRKAWLEVGVPQRVLDEAGIL